MPEDHDFGPNPFSGCCWPYPGADATEAREFRKKYGDTTEVRTLQVLMLKQIAQDYGISSAELIERFEAEHERSQDFRKKLGL
ncbi:hypothetical protein KBY83_12115 [Cyanobium sp. WKJ7-Wakatipu]|nr:hypothetical protein [Cyanobium sp. WKJ7-Wakatipu]